MLQFAWFYQAFRQVKSYWSRANWGIRGMHGFGVDYTGRSDAEALVVLVDCISLESGGKLPTGEPVWQMHTGGNLAVEGNSFVIRGGNDASLQGIFLVPSDVKLTAEKSRLTATGGREFFVVMTIQKGEALEIERFGSGLGTRVKIGRQQISFDGNAIRIEDR